MSRVRERLADERGLTLIELIISMGVLGIIIVPLTSSFLIGLVESSSTRDRIADSSAAQAISAFLLTDIQSSDAVATSGSGCLPPAGYGGTSTVKLQLSWTDHKTSVATTVSYIDHTPAGSSQHRLLRVSCSGGATTAEPAEIAAYLDASAGFVVECDGLPTCTNPVKVVTVDVKAKSDSPSSASSYTPFEFELMARRRVG
jgi:prepilin-type N-terminal cleavage/methylation domain-containing protein